MQRPKRQRRQSNFEHRMCSKKIRDILRYLLFFPSARRGSNPRPSPWQGDAPPLSHSRIFYCFSLLSVSDYVIIQHIFLFVNTFFHLFFNFFQKKYVMLFHDIFLTHVNLFSDYILYVSTFNISATLINNFLQISDNSDIQLSTINHIVKNTKGICDRHRLLIRPVR